jgi:hypothetical protein
MINIRALELAAFVAGVSILCGSAQAQNDQLASTPTVQGSGAPSVLTQTPIGTASAPMLQRIPRTTTPRVPPKAKPISLDDLLAGITLSDEQRPRIEQVRKDMRARMDRVVYDKNENADQKQAMLQGLQHMELREVYLLLTQDQRMEVRNKIAAQRAAEQQPIQKVQQESQPK